MATPRREGQQAGRRGRAEHGRRCCSRDVGGVGKLKVAFCKDREIFVCMSV
jgi:hypothetical protein